MSDQHQYELNQTEDDCEYKTITSRIETFKNYPKSPDFIIKLAEAGFFSIGKNYITKCFSCTVYITDWEDKDDPWIEHARYAPYCDFLNIKCGQAFISSCKGMNPLPLPEVQKPSTNLDRYTCKICLVNEIGCSFYPCEHTITCVDCSPILTRCPLCRRFIYSTYRLKFID